jgi:hypothetical protein
VAEECELCEIKAEPDRLLALSAQLLRSFLGPEKAA